MPRRLTDAEREERRKERNRRAASDAAYKHHYDPTAEGFGSSQQWQDDIAARLGAPDAGFTPGGFTIGGTFKPAPRRMRDPDLEMLNLEAMPDDLAVLKTAFRRRARQTHSDSGNTGASDAAFIQVKAAYDRLVKRFEAGAAARSSYAGSHRRRR